MLSPKIVLTFHNFGDSKASIILSGNDPFKILDLKKKCFRKLISDFFLFFYYKLFTFRKNQRVLLNTYSCTINGEACQQPCGRQPKYKGRNWCWIVQNWTNNIFGHRWDYCNPGPLKES